jgi:hypothetical protein
MSIDRHPLIRALALTLVLGAVLAPVASARSISDAPSTHPTFASQVLASPPRTVTIVRPSGFDWGDAAIGAGAVGVLALAGLGARLSIGHRRQLHSNAARSGVAPV